MQLSVLRHAAARGRAVIIGGGPVGGAMAVICRKHNFEVDIYEKYSDLRLQPLNARRSINLVLGRRGTRLAESLGLRDELLSNTVPVLGRMIHDIDGSQHYQPYGLEGECNYSIDRGQLNAFWLNAAANAGARLHFDHMLNDFDLSKGTATFVHTSSPKDMSADRNLNLNVLQESDRAPVDVRDIDLLFGCDGAGSLVRRKLVERYSTLSETIDFIGWGYKEVQFPAARDSEYAMDSRALHIWPRKDHFLMALANPNGSFTGTMYVDDEMPRPNGSTPMLSGAATFQSTASDAASREFWETYYPDALQLVGEDGLRQYRDNPSGVLGTVRTKHYFAQDSRSHALLAGDAAHAIVPFFGQGVQSGLEDAFDFGEVLNAAGNGHDLGHVVQEYSNQRVRNNEALREMALENAVEMGDKVGQTRFRLRKALEERIELELPHKYRSRYALVCYSHNPYSAVYEFGKVQSNVLETLIDKMLSTNVTDVAHVDMKHVEDAIDHEIAPAMQRMGISLACS